MKIRPVGSELIHVGRQTWRSKQSVVAVLERRLKNVLLFYTVSPSGRKWTSDRFAVLGYDMGTMNLSNS